MYDYASEVGNRELLDAVQRMAYMAEYREGNNASHLERIRGYCHVIASALGLSSDEAEVISYASQLHDVGKIAIPDGIAKKSDKLEPHEWEIVESHTTVGAALLRGSSSLIVQTGELIALSHHERWDGSGYPRGLEGEKIPISGRICALADVFDALTSKRPYKDEIPPKEALKLVMDSRGTLFDPEMVDIFDNRFDEILRTRRNFQ